MDAEKGAGRWGGNGLYLEGRITGEGSTHARAKGDVRIFHSCRKNASNRNLIITADQYLFTIIQGCPMKQEKISGTEKKAPAGRGEGLNQTERSILQKSTDRHDKALRILSKL